jgi:hypothetical protein
MPLVDESGDHKLLAHEYSKGYYILMRPAPTSVGKVGRTHQVGHPVKSNGPTKDSYVDSISERILLESYNTL